MKTAQTSNIHFHHSDLSIREVMYSRCTNKKGKRCVVVRLPYGTQGKWRTTYTSLPIAESGMSKIWSKSGPGSIPMDFPANILIYKGIVVGIEIKPFDHALEIMEFQERMHENVRLLENHVTALRLKGFEVFSDLNGVYWKAKESENTMLTSDGTLQGVKMGCIAYNDFNATPETAITPKEKYAIQYQHPTRKELTAITTPIFSSAIGLGSKYETKKSDTETDIDLNDPMSQDEGKYPIDMITKNFRINLRFMIRTTLKLNKFVDTEELDKVFGIYETVLALGVVSLPKLPQATQDKYPIRLSVKDCIIWLLGLQTRYADESIQNLEIIRTSIKFLLTKSLTKEGQADPKNLFNEGYNANSLKNLKSLGETII